ncbi:MAG: exodeoxyribonuclease VII small subunit [Bacilli bacterium]|nr:exodeoxyribonuclease VII small subunit [Bacilli bacterium]
MKFEEKIKELEKTINELENGEIDLEESINKYTSAMKLVKECDEQLNNIEKQVSKIVLENGEEDFQVEE